MTNNKNSGAARGKLKTQKNIIYFLFCMPMMLYLFVFCYLPMGGAMIAFKHYRYDAGILGSPWAGFDNFKFFFKSIDVWNVTRNTLGYNFVFIILGIVIPVTVAILLFEIKQRFAVKAYQTVMFLPYFMSWIVVAYMVYAFLNPLSGIANQVIKALGKEPIDFYVAPKPWIFILPIAQVWKTVGFSALMYYANLMGIDTEYFDAAKIDGATKFQIVRHITIPFLYPLIVMLSILSVGKIFNADFGLFYQLPMGSSMLLPTTDVIETYIFRALVDNGNIDMSSAIGLFKSVVNMTLVIITNAITRKISAENALF